MSSYSQLQLQLSTWVEAFRLVREQVALFEHNLPDIVKIIHTEYSPLVCQISLIV